MEVVLESTEGVPEGGVLSIMIGETKRQALASRLGQPFRFADAPVPAEGGSPLPFKVELLVPAAPPQVMVLDPTDDHFVVDFGGQMQVMLQQRENPDLHRPVVDVSGAAATHGLPSQKLAVAQRVASYLEEHDLVRTFQDLLNSLLLVKPDDPHGWVEECLVRERLLMNKRKRDITLKKNRRQSRGERTAVRQSMRGSVGSLGKVETLLLSLQSCRENLELIMPLLPPDLQSELNSPDFVAECLHQFQRLDRQGTGRLQPEDLIPILVQISGTKARSVGRDQCQHLVDMFDIDEDGLVDQDEFVNLTQFVIVASFIESDAGQDVLEAACIEEEKFEIFLEMVAQDRERLWTIVPFLPYWLKEHVTGAEFQVAASARFRSLDADNSGALEPLELIDVVRALSEAHPMTIDSDKCRRFVQIFDFHGNGVILRNEFVEFAQFLTVMNYLSTTQEGRQVKQMIDASTSRPLASDPGNNHDKLNWCMCALERDKANLPAVLRSLPGGLVAELTNEAFTRACLDGFTSLDVDNSGVLDPQELFAVVYNLAQVHPFNTDAVQCKRFTAIFDKDTNGLVSKEEFVDLTRFIITMGYLEHALAHEEMNAAELLLGEDRVHKLIDAVRGQADRLPDILPYLPEDLLEEIRSEGFHQRCESDFALLDKDGSGVLEPRELFPVILNLSEGHHWNLTEDHCHHFVDIFDIQRNGVITIDEYISFAGFMLIMAFMQTEEGVKVQFDIEVAQTAHEVENLLQMLAQDRGAIHKVIPLLPSDYYNQLTSHDFIMACKRRFLMLDQDKTSVLRPRELIPVVAELAGSFQQAITVDQCERFVDIFDIKRDGVLNLEEFLDFSRFVCIMCYLNSPEGKAACQDAFQVMHDSSTAEDLCATAGQTAEAGGQMRGSTPTPLWAEPSPSDILNDLMKERAAKPNSLSAKAAESPAGAAERSLDLEPEATDDFSGLSNNLAILGLDTPGFDIHEKSEKLSAENDTLRDRLSSLEDLIKTLEGR